LPDRYHVLTLDKIAFGFSDKPYSCAPVSLSVRRDHFSFESARAAQGIRYQAGVVCPLKQLVRLANVRPRRNG
jgi:hypothetical protein